jgi:hypothetical protein
LCLMLIKLCMGMLKINSVLHTATVSLSEFLQKIAASLELLVQIIQQKNECLANMLQGRYFP